MIPTFLLSSGAVSESHADANTARPSTINDANLAGIMGPPAVLVVLQVPSRERELAMDVMRPARGEVLSGRRRRAVRTAGITTATRVRLRPRDACRQPPRESPVCPGCLPVLLLAHIGVPCRCTSLIVISMQLPERNA